MATLQLDSVLVPRSRVQGQPLRQRLRTGVVLLGDVPGAGAPVRRQRRYGVQLRWWLGEKQPVRWVVASGPVGVARLEDDGGTLITQILVNRGQVLSGVFCGLEGMRVGGMRRLEIAPHMAYGDSGVPGRILAGAALILEVTVLRAANPDVAGSGRATRWTGRE